MVFKCYITNYCSGLFSIPNLDKRIRRVVYISGACETAINAGKAQSTVTIIFNYDVHTIECSVIVNARQSSGIFCNNISVFTRLIEGHIAEFEGNLVA